MGRIPREGRGKEKEKRKKGWKIKRGRKDKK